MPKALSKTLRGLIERAERNGSAVKRVREGHVSGNWYYGDKGELIDQWKVVVVRNTSHEHVEVYHYGTLIAHIMQVHGQLPALVRYYGESVSDRDALNGLCDYYGIDRQFSYRPSTGEFLDVTQYEDIGEIQSELSRAYREKLHEEAPWILGGVE